MTTGTLTITYNIGTNIITVHLGRARERQGTRLGVLSAIHTVVQLEIT